MSKNTNKTPNNVLETDTIEDVIEVSQTSYGTIMESLYVEPKKTNKKDDVRDYKRTPEVNEILSKYSSKSEAIRALNTEGYKKGEIADLLRIRYQHVNNVLNQKLKTA